MPDGGIPTHATCPECGASVPLVGERWLHVHRIGSAEYAYPRGARARCPGSLMLAQRPNPHADPLAPHAPYGSAESEAAG